ncbi:MAG: DUF2079 domain-containing protein [Polyangiaceae bacterium]|jgi:uncharacterized membrane protein|nr:DUF2079 domain-containing protein [Polyangiaceae bacterium]MBK8942300.1 DUF2079 domain-containing protein [Polyangiaceae bacterium]
MEAKGRRALRWLDATLTALARIGTAVLSYLSVVLLGPLLAASAYWFWKGPEQRLKLLDTNKLTGAEQAAASKAGFVALGIVLITVPALHFAWTRRKGFGFAAAAQRLGHYLTPLLAVPFVVALMQKGVEKESPKLTLFFCAIIAGIVGVATYRIATFARFQIEDTRRRRILNIASIVATWGALLAMWGGYSYLFTKLAITNHHGFGTRTIDLGLYDQIFYQSAHGKPLGCTFIKSQYHGSAHFDPILVALSPLYKLYPRVELILGLQSVWCGSGVIPVYLLARQVLGSRLQGLLLAGSYALHPALHGANLYEFHSLTLSCVPILWTLWALHTGRLKAYWALLFVALTVREDIPLMMIPVGLVAMLIPDGKLRRTGFFTVIFCAVYFVVVKKFFMTSSGVIMGGGAESYSYAYYYDEMIPDRESGLKSMFLTLFSNPTFALRQALEEPKLVYITTVFLPMLFMPFFAKSWRMTLLYGLAFTTLATRTAVFSTHFQYSMSILPFAFAAIPLGLKAFSEGTLATAYGLEPVRLRRALAFAAFAASAATSYKFGAIVENQSFRGGFVRIHRTLTPEQQAQYDWMEEAKKQIPPKASVGVTQKIGPHVSNRKEVYLYGQHKTQYVFVDERELKGEQSKRHKKAVADGRLEVVTKRGSMVLYRDMRFFKKAQKPKKDDPKAPKDEPLPDDGGADDDEGGDVRDVLGDEPKDE